MRTLLLLAGCGALGTLARYGTVLLAQRWQGTGFAWGTLAVNVAGCLAIGLLMGAALPGALGRDLRLLSAVGFLGAFTTFSAFGYEMLMYLQNGEYRSAALYLFASLVLGFAAVALGLMIGRSVWPA